ncbi:undecaprenyl-phosphate alpha-N-acetylglucosaminyl 1-phosphate transferase [Mucilaginibacter sp. PAMC 26640]|nr:undecaprenyl-phosphate alpha-N-acetylglucosaminyl 1-phosphate transferase [Mucilaginibacter sp. PAMC 26640]
MNNFHWYYILVFLLSVLFTWLCIPSILHVARARHLYDDVGHFRKQHDHGIPRLGGVAIFASFNITLLLLSMVDNSLPLTHLLTASIVLFAVGLKDDLSGVNSSTKFLIQFFVAAILVLPGNIRLTSLYGIFGIYEISYFLSVILSLLFIVLIVNAFNLIDGIDGLAAVTCVVVNGSFTILFIYIGQLQLAAIALSITGAVVGFLRFNLTPAKIFMGDTGSLLLGLISAFLTIKFLEINKSSSTNAPLNFPAPALTLAILIGPVFDTLRVFTLRILRGISPFTADRNHIHHLVLRLGLSHSQTTFLLAAINILCIVMVIVFNELSNLILITMILGTSLLFALIITYLVRSRSRESYHLRNLFA